jgi:hypothetical protein
MDISNYYKWEVETNTGNIYTSGNIFDGIVVRISFLPSILVLPRHDIIFSNDFKYVKRFCRGLLKQSVGMKEYLHCVVTNKFRFYLKSSNGTTLITDKDYDLYL